MVLRTRVARATSLVRRTVSRRLMSIGTSTNSQSTTGRSHNGDWGMLGMVAWFPFQARCRELQSGRRAEVNYTPVIRFRQATTSHKCHIGNSGVIAAAARSQLGDPQAPIGAKVAPPGPDTRRPN